MQASLDVHPAALPFGATLTVNRVGEMFDTVAGFGHVPSGDYTVVDLSGRVFLDRRRRHRINLRLENLFDEDYTTRHARGFRDAPVDAVPRAQPGRAADVPRLVQLLLLISTTGRRLAAASSSIPASADSYTSNPGPSRLSCSGGGDVADVPPWRCLRWLNCQLLL